MVSPDVWDVEAQVRFLLPRPTVFNKGNNMTCRGYDPKAVKIGSLVKMAASTILDPHKRGAFMRSYVKIAESELRTPNRKDSK